LLLYFVLKPYIFYNMDRICEAIEIKRPPEEVFSFLRKIEPRLKLSPVYELLSFTKLTEGEIREGSRYRAKIRLKDGRVSEYEAIVTAFKENEVIETSEVSGKFRVRITLKKTKHGTLLIQEEAFSEEVLFQKEHLSPQETTSFHVQAFIESESRERETLTFLKKLFTFLLAIERTGFSFRKNLLEEVKAEMRENLKEWLKRIKNELEK